MRSGKAGLVLVALAAQWALAGGPPSFASLQAHGVQPAGLAAGPEAHRARSSEAGPVGPAGEAAQVVALQVGITR